MPHTLEAINDDNFAAQVLSSSQPVVVDFGAPWCAPCRRLAPMLAEAAQQQGIRAVYVDIEQSPEAARACQVRAVPSIVVFSDGVEVQRHIGLPSRAKLLKLLAMAQ